MVTASKRIFGPKRLVRLSRRITEVAPKYPNSARRRIGIAATTGLASKVGALRDPAFYVSGLLDLHKVEDHGERRAIWRQSLATLARDTDGPGPLEGIQPEALLLGFRTAL